MQEIEDEVFFTVSFGLSIDPVTSSKYVIFKLLQNLTCKLIIIATTYLLWSPPTAIGAYFIFE